MSKIKQFRTKVGLTQEELAKKLNVNQPTVAMWETSKTLPRTDKLPKLAEIFGCKIDELF